MTIIGEEFKGKIRIKLDHLVTCFQTDITLPVAFPILKRKPLSEYEENQAVRILRDIKTHTIVNIIGYGVIPKMPENTGLEKFNTDYVLPIRLLAEYSKYSIEEAKEMTGIHIKHIQTICKENGIYTDLVGYRMKNIRVCKNPKHLDKKVLKNIQFNRQYPPTPRILACKLHTTYKNIFKTVIELEEKNLVRRKLIVTITPKIRKQYQSIDLFVLSDIILNAALSYDDITEVLGFSRDQIHKNLSFHHEVSREVILHSSKHELFLKKALLLKEILGGEKNLMWYKRNGYYNMVANVLSTKFIKSNIVSPNDNSNVSPYLGKPGTKYDQALEMCLEGRFTVGEICKKLEVREGFIKSIARARRFNYRVVGFGRKRSIPLHHASLRKHLWRNVTCEKKRKRPR